MKIYTRTGDAGTTALVGGKRVSKASLRLDAYGTVDELNSFLGLLATEALLDDDSGKTLQMVQNKLFNVGAYLATDNTDSPMAEPAGLGHKAIGELERQIDLMTDALPPLRAFILPGDAVPPRRPTCAVPCAAVPSGGLWRWRRRLVWMTR